MSIKLVPVTEECLPFCRLLYNQAVANSTFSLLEPAELLFDTTLQRPDSIFRMIVNHDEDSPEESTVVGLFGLEKIRWVDRVAQVVVSIAEQEKNNGYAKEAGKVFLKDLTQKYNLRRVVGVALEDSFSERLLQEAGFTKEGTLREEKFHEGSYLNGVIYGWVKE